MAILFDYKCTSCAHHEEVWLTNGTITMKCPACDETTFQRSYSAPNVSRSNQEHPPRSLQ